MIERMTALIRYGREKARADGIPLGFISVLRIILENLDVWVRKRDYRKSRSPSILIITLPKSGSMFIHNSLARRCGLHPIPTGDHGFPFSVLDELKLKKFAIGCAIDQAHYMPSTKNLSLLKKHHINKIVVHFRDPRQALVSWVHYADKFHTDHDLFAYEDIDIPLDYFEKSFEEKIDIMIELYYPWFVAFVDRWLAYEREDIPKWGIEVRFTEFRKMKNDPDSFFNEICEFYEINQEGLRQNRINPQGAHSHDRKGELEEWRQVFTPDQIRKTSAVITSEMVEKFGWSRP